MHITNTAVLVPPTPTSNGSEILARFDCDLGDVLINDLALVRTSRGQLTIWSKRAGGDRRPIVAFSREASEQVIDQLTTTIPSLAGATA